MINNSQAAATSPGEKITVCALWKDPKTGSSGREKLSLMMPHCAQKTLGRKTGKVVLHPYHAGDDSFFVSEHVCASRLQAKLEICEVFRKLQFIHATGLLPAQDFVVGRSIPHPPKALDDPRAPFHHRLSFWGMAGYNRAVVLIERQFKPSQLQSGFAADKALWADTLAWASDHKCKAIPLMWSGMLNPEGGTRVLALAQTDARYDLSAMRLLTDGLSELATPSNWDRLIANPSLLMR